MSYGCGKTMVMENERMFASGEAGIPARGADRRSLDGGDGCDAERRIGDVLDQLDRFVEVETSRSHIGEALGLLERVQTRVSAHMCELTRRAAAARPDSDPVEVLREKTRLSGRDAKRIAKVAGRLDQMPKVAERFADGDITLDNATALAGAADKIGPEAVEADPSLLEAAETTPPDTFARKARDWAHGKLIRGRRRHLGASAAGSGGQAVDGPGHRDRDAVRQTTRPPVRPSAPGRG